MIPTTPKIPAVFPPGASNGIALVGESGGEEEESSGLPFQGKAGKLLNKMTARVGINREECLITNVFKYHPKKNDLWGWSIPKGKLPSGYSFPSFGQSLYIEQEFLNHSLGELREELKRFKPKIVVALGQTAMVALTRIGKIKNYRGTVLASTLVPGSRVIPTYHPAGITRNWGLLPIGLVDLLKAKREAGRVKEVLERKIEVVETPFDVGYLESVLYNVESLCFDVETLGDYITSIGFSVDPTRAFVVPFYHKGGLWWDSLESEVQVWKTVKDILESPTPKITQNGIFDIQRLLVYGIQVRNLSFDTMFFYHAYQPELPKNLGFLGSFYTDMPAWKQLRETGIATDED